MLLGLESLDISIKKIVKECGSGTGTETITYT